MRNILVALLAIILSVSPMLAQNGDNELTEEQLKEFKRTKLAIETYGQSIGSFSPGLGLSSGSSWRQWRAYEGFNPMTEGDFFRKTGYINEASNADKYHIKTETMINYGMLGSLGGFAIVLVGYSRTKITNYQFLGDIEESDPNYELIIVGGIISIAGSATVYNGRARRNMNWAPYATVSGITDEYNKKLIIGIKKNF